jgi:hypothetical protein
MPPSVPEEVIARQSPEAQQMPGRDAVAGGVRGSDEVDP